MEYLINYWRSLAPITRNLLRFALINIILVNFILLVALDVPKIDTVLYHTKTFLGVKLEKGDSWDPMQSAFDYITTQNEEQEPLYDRIFFDQKTKFQYPPSSLLVFYPMQYINRVLRYTSISSNNFLNVVSWLAVAINIHFTIKIFNFSLEKNKNSNFVASNNANYSPKSEAIVRILILLSLALTFYPIVKAFSLGQIQTWLNALFAILVWCWIKQKKTFSGILVGVMCLIKPQYSVIVLWGILRKQWSFFIASAITAGMGILVSFLMFGIENNINYLDVLSFISKHGEAFYPNQSVNGLMNRLLFNGNNLIWQGDAFPPFNRIVYIATVSSSIALMSIALFKPQKTSEKGGVVDLFIIAVTSTMASPVAWEHHYGILLPIYAFLAPYLLTRRVFGWWTVPFFCASYILTSNYLVVANKLAYAKFNLNILQSYLLIGALMLLVYLYFFRNSQRVKLPEKISAQADWTSNKVGSTDH